ncbi:MFS transporter [Agrococcus jejuensis]|uniref:Putative proline/betaine transporter n=1 Tax=Agrococcus jejuensis TaxID=399736 RepID=A0A1G8A0I5_9MICO|nr:MFS transporter [Agrococcus jejuensis]SDH14411.1 MFS transporter, MHS family, alpha-ketoglutarate permease [Agrococcus jejuensis]
MTTLAATQSTRQRLRQISAAAVGNAIEWYDWYIYSLLAAYFAAQYFPSDSESTLVPLLSALAVFAVGFVMRPIGGLLVGWFADRVGRKAALNVTVIGMGAGSLLIAVIPTYESIGILAPIALVVARMVQGLSAGGEYAAAAAFLVESAPNHRRGFFASFFYQSAIIGNLFAIGLTSLLSTTLSAEDMTAWGWRVPFAVGAVVAVSGYWIRRHAEETHTLLADMESGAVEKPSPFEFLKHPKLVVQTIGITAAGTLIYYVWTVYMPTYANVVTGLDTRLGLGSTAITLVFFLILQPIVATISDKVGRKPVLLVFGCAFVFGTVPMLSLLQDSFWSLLLVQMLGAGFLACWTSILNAVFAELWPARVRAAGAGLPYSSAVALFGGTGPYIATAFAQAGNPEYFGYYLTAIAIISTVTYLTLKETAHKPLP